MTRGQADVRAASSHRAVSTAAAAVAFSVPVLVVLGVGVELVNIHVRQSANN